MSFAASPNPGWIDVIGSAAVERFIVPTPVGPTLDAFGLLEQHPIVQLAFVKRVADDTYIGQTLDEDDAFNADEALSPARFVAHLLVHELLLGGAPPESFAAGLLIGDSRLDPIVDTPALMVARLLSSPARHDPDDLLDAIHDVVLFIDGWVAAQLIAADLDEGGIRHIFQQMRVDFGPVLAELRQPPASDQLGLTPEEIAMFDQLVTGFGSDAS